MTVLPMADWRQRPGLERIVAALSADGGAVRYVGGAVRDTLLGLAVTDVDLATPLLPGDVIQRLEASGIKAVPTGLAHGTITAVADGDAHEITTLRRDLATDGRRATIAFADDWQEDAARRDFTINALYANPDSGDVFDWFDGLADLAARRVVFIGDPGQRIAEDHLRILRFYRFAARFGDARLDAASHAAVIAHRASLKSLSRERVADELFKLFALPDPRWIAGHMGRDGIFAEILPELAPTYAASLDHLLANEAEAGAGSSALRRLAALLPTDAMIADGVAGRLRLSTRQKKHLVALAEYDPADLSRPAGQLAYAWGAEVARDTLLLHGDMEKVAADCRLLASWHRPQLSIKGGDIVARGVAVGPDVARILKAVEAAWVAENFPGPARVAELLDQRIG